MKKASSKDIPQDDWLDNIQVTYHPRNRQWRLRCIKCGDIEWLTEKDKNTPIMSLGVTHKCKDDPNVLTVKKFQNCIKFLFKKGDLGLEEAKWIGDLSEEELMDEEEINELR